MNRRVSYAALVWIFTATAIVMAQDLPTAKPDAVGLSAERLGEPATQRPAGLRRERDGLAPATPLRACAGELDRVCLRRNGG